LLSAYCFLNKWLCSVFHFFVENLINWCWFLFLWVTSSGGVLQNFWILSFTFTPRVNSEMQWNVLRWVTCISSQFTI